MQRIFLLLLFFSVSANLSAQAISGSTGKQSAAGSPLVQALAGAKNNVSEQIFNFDFSAGPQGWTHGFADLPINSEEFFELAFGLRPLPPYLINRRGGARDRRGARMQRVLFIAGHNHSDDLFMFLKRQLTGLKPKTTYQVRFFVQFATDAPSGCIGVGGAPGESVYFKVGGAAFEPQALVENGEYRMNLDKGNQSSGGQHALVLGHIANPYTDCNQPKYAYKVLNNETKPLELATNANGELWVMLGTDSGFEGKTSLYYSLVKIILQEK